MMSDYSQLTRIRHCISTPRCNDIEILKDIPILFSISRFLAVVILSISVFSCSPIVYNYHPPVSDFSIPELNIEMIRGIGEPLLDQGKLTLRDVLFIKKETTLALYRVVPGKLVKIGEDEESEFYGQEMPAIIYSSFTHPAPSATVMRNKITGECCIVRPGDIDICGGLNTERNKEQLVTIDSFRRTLLYSGRVGNKLKISYREFSGNLARAAFSNEVEYDLNESGIIGYAGARIEVLNATNTQITYKVLRNFNTQ